MPSPEPSLAVFIDLEHIAGVLSPKHLHARILSIGSPVVQRVYAHWSHHPSTRVSFLEYDIQPIDCAPNAAHTTLLLDAVETALTEPNIQSFVIASANPNILPLLQRLRRYRRTITLITLPQAASSLLPHVDTTLYLPSLSHTPPSIALDDTDTPQNPAFQLLLRALHNLSLTASAPFTSSLVKTAMLQLDPSFNQKRFGYSKFKTFLQAAEVHRAIHLIHLPDGNVQVEPRPAQPTSTTTPPEKLPDGLPLSDLKRFHSALERHDIIFAGYESHTRILASIHRRLSSSPWKATRSDLLSHLLSQSHTHHLNNLPLSRLELRRVISHLVKARALTEDIRPGGRIFLQLASDISTLDDLTTTHHTMLLTILTGDGVTFSPHTWSLLLYGTPDQTRTIRSLQSTIHKRRHTPPSPPASPTPQQPTQSIDPTGSERIRQTMRSIVGGWNPKK